MAGKKVQLKNQNNNIYPYTQTDCVFDENGDSLETLLDGPELLWTNPDPTSSFAQTTFNISNYEKYNKLLFIFNESKSKSTYKLCYEVLATLEIDDIAFPFIGVQFSTSGGSNFLVSRRVNIFLDKTRVFISNCYYWTNINTMSTNNDLFIPYQIYGIK